MARHRERAEGWELRWVHGSKGWAPGEGQGPGVMKLLLGPWKKGRGESQSGETGIGVPMYGAQVGTVWAQRGTVGLPQGRGRP